MKLLHTSDWHLGRQLHNQSLLDDQRHVLEQIVRLAALHQVDVVIIAGDIYDRSLPPASAVALLDHVLNQLIQTLNIPVILIAGNHDSHERLGFAARQLSASGLHIIGPLTDAIQGIVIQSAHEEMLFFGLPYAEPATVRQVFGVEAQTHEQALNVLLEQVRQYPGEDANKVVISHCFLAGGESSDSERPLSLGGAEHISPSVFAPFAYAALGHLHGAQYKLAPHIRYSGSPLKYSFSEQHQKKSVTLVTLEQHVVTHIELLPLTPLRDVRILEGHLAELLRQGEQDPNNDDYLMVRLLDKNAILDAMGKLRSVYPNVLHLERTGLMAASERLVTSRNHMKKSELTMFADFFQQVSGQSLSKIQQDIVSDCLDSIHQGEISQ